MSFEEIQRFFEEINKISEAASRLQTLEKSLDEKEIQQIIKQYRANNLGSIEGLGKYLLEYHSELLKPKTETEPQKSVSIGNAKEFVKVAIESRDLKVFVKKKAIPFIEREYYEKKDIRFRELINALFIDLQEKYNTDELKAFNLIALLQPYIYRFSHRQGYGIDYFDYELSVEEFLENGNAQPLIRFLGIKDRSEEGSQVPAVNNELKNAKSISVLERTKEERSKEDIKALEELLALIPEEKPVNLDEVFGRKRTDLNKVDTPTSETINNKRMHRRETKRGLNQITYGIDYVPLNRDVEATKDIENDRNFIYSFKNGNYTQKHIQMLENLIDPNYYSLVDDQFKFHSATLILPIPASTKNNQKNRYEKFLAEFCENKDSLVNGYDLVKIDFDREAIHMSETRLNEVNYKVNLLVISLSSIKNIIIIDDLVTQGKTINTFLDVLGIYKSKVKQIITFGATV